MEKPSLDKPVIAVVGPTASGKSSLAQALALALDGEVVSADSMQIYRGMDIGTGKLLSDERLVPHHCLDIIDPGRPFSAALFQREARKCFETLDAQGKRSILCGGTGFYIRAAIDDYDFPAGEQQSNPLRERYQAMLKNQGARKLWEALRDVDPESAELIPENDSKRVIRALELLEEGTSYAHQKAALQSIPQAIPALFIGLDVDPAILRKRIDERVDAMVEEGLVAEVEGLLAQGFREGLCAPQAIGYKEIVAALDGRMSLQEAIDAMKIATHRYAKRQRTWFRKDQRIHWIDGNSLNPETQLAQSLAFIDRIEREGKGAIDDHL